MNFLRKTVVSKRAQPSYNIQAEIPPPIFFETAYIYIMMKCPVHKNHRGSLGFPGVMSSNPAVSGMISGKLILTA